MRKNILAALLLAVLISLFMAISSAAAAEKIVRVVLPDCG